MEEEAYIVFEIDSPGAGDFRFRESAAEPLAASLNVERLTPSDVADAKRRPNRFVGPLLPTKLVKPVSIADVARPAAAGSAWGIDAVGATGSPFTGMGIKVAALDTGIDDEHEAFHGIRVTKRDFTGEGPGDENGHGTHCAGTIAGRDVNGYRFGVATGVEDLLVGKVLGKGGGSTDAIVRGIMWAVDSGASVISMSLGIDFPGAVASRVDQGIPIESATSQALQGYRDNLRIFEAVAGFIRANAAFGRSGLVVAATGNESKRAASENPYTVTVAPPAASEGFIAVGAVQRNPDGGLAVASFSNAGASVVGPGVEIPSAKAGGGFVALSGTSMATPHVAGVAALWAQKMAETDGAVDPTILAQRVTGYSQALAGLSPDDVGSGLVRAPTH